MKHLALAVLALATAAQGAAQDPTPRELTAYLPAATPVVVDLYDGAACLEALRDFLEPLPKGLPGPVVAAVQAFPLLVKARTGMTPEDLLTVLGPGQVTAALFPGGPGGHRPFPVVMSRIEDAEEIRRVLRRLGRKLPIHVGDRILTLSNSRRNLEKVLGFRSRGQPSLLQNRHYISGRIGLEPHKSVRVYLDLDYLRRIRGRGFYDALPGVARLLVGPLARVLDAASRVDARLDLLPDGLRLHGRLDATAATDKGLLRYGVQGRRLPPAPAGTLAAVSLDRDLGAFFENADRLLDEDAATNVKKFLSVANRFLGRLDFTADLLAAFELPGAVFVTDTAPESAQVQPRVRLPAFTLVARLTGHEQRAVRRALARALESVGFLATVERRRNKRYPVQLRARTETRGDYRLQYLAYGDWDGPGAPPTDLNFGVTLLFAHDHLILSSTRDGAVRAADAISGAKEVGSRVEPVRGDYLQLTGAGMADYIARNLDVLALDRVLKEGQVLRAARQFWRTTAAVLKALEAEVKVVPGPEDTGFSLLLRRVSR